MILPYKQVPPAINTGVDVGLTEDILGNPIVGLPDIGAYEFIPLTNGIKVYSNGGKLMRGTNGKIAGYRY